MMNDEKVSEYLLKIKEEKAPFNGDVEEEIAKAFRKTGIVIQNILGNLQKLEDEQDNLKNKYMDFSSKMDAYTTLLIAFENKRLEAKNDDKGR